MGELGTFTKGAALSKADISENGTPFILYGELYTTYNEVAYEIKRKTTAIAPKECYSISGDVIIPTSGETPEEIATSTCVMKQNVILGGDLNIFRSEMLDGRITSYIINHKINKTIAKIAQGKSVVHIKADDLKKLQICFPEKDEQNKIIKFLDLLNSKIEKQRQLVGNLKKYKRGLFESCFSKLTEFKNLKLGSFAKIYQPATISQSEFTSGPYRVFGANGYIGYYDEYNHSAAQVTVSCRGEKCGTVNYVDAKTWITGNSMVINIDDNENLNKRFLYHCLSNQNLKYLISGSAQPQIVRSSIEQHKIPCPNLAEQNKIAIILDKYESLIQTSETTLSELIKYKSGLLQQMFI